MQLNLNTFLIIIIAFLPFVLCFFYRERNVSRNPIPYVGVLAIAVLLSYLTFAHYAKSDGGYYKNTDYHIIQQDGFKYPQGQTLRLSSDNAPDSALLATGIGELWIDPSMRLHAEGFRQPLYVEDTGKIGKLNFHVVNNIEELSIKNGEELLIARQKDWSANEGERKPEDVDTLLRIKYEEVIEKGKVDKYRFVFSLSGAQGYDTVYESRFRQGLSLTSILQKGATTSLDAGTMSLYENCYIIRDHYKLDEIVNAKTPKESAPVYLFVDDRLNNDSCFFYIDGKQLTLGRPSVVVPKMKDRQFFFGLGENKSPVYKYTLDGEEVFVKYRLPKMYHFPDFKEAGETKMYLTTDINDIIDHRNEYKCFYQFNEQLTDGNIYKASAVLDFFISDSSGVSISPIYADRFDENKDAGIEIDSTNEFKVKTSSCRGNSNIAQVSYVFRIRDMRNNEVFRNSKWLYCAMLFMFMVILFIISQIASKSRNLYVNKLYIIETSVYLVLIAFLTVRLILLWRLHTFPPIDHVSYMEFAKLTSSSIFNWTIACVVGILGLRIVILSLQWIFYNKPNFCFSVWVENFFNWIEAPRFRHHKVKRQRIKIKQFTIPMGWVAAAILLPALTYGFCIVLGLPTFLKVAVKEAVAPLLAFVINSIFYVFRNNSSGQQSKTERRNRGIFCWAAIIVNTMMFFGYLFVVNELGMLFPMLAVFGVWFIIAAFLSIDHILWKIFVFLVVVFGFIIVFLHVPMEQKSWGKKVISAVWMPSRIRARMETLAYTPTEMMQNHSAKFKDTSMQEILNASSNKWFIDNHLIQRDYIEQNHDGFALDKEYNQLAVSYEVQTRDVLLLRYIIYEHGKGVVKKMLWIFWLLTLNVFVVYRRKAQGNDKLPYLQQLPLQSALYLLMFSVYLYLVNLNAVVFVGLDFPFLTLTSKVAPLGLLLPLLAILLPVNMRKMDTCFTPNFDRDNDKSKFYCLIFLAAIWIFVGLPANKMKKTLAAQKETTSFSVSMAPLAEFINNYLNPRFKEYQENEDAGQKLANKSIDFKELKNAIDVYLGDINDPNSNFGSALTEFDQKSQYKHLSDDFIKSAFEHLRHTSLTNTRNILHVRKLNGKFVFVTNKVFYDMKPMFDNSSVAPWRGDLLAATSASKLTFAGEDGKTRAIEVNRSLFKFGGENDNIKYLCDKDNEVSFYLYQIPSKYCYNEKGDVFVMVRNPVADDDIKVAPKDDPTSSFRESMGIRVFPNDAIKVGKAAKSFSLVTESNHYFSKRIHYNGKDQVIYPMGNKFMFAYNFDQMLYDGYHPQKATDSVRISLDYELLSEVQQYCEDLVRRGNRSKYGDGIAVTAIDGNGRIRLLADYNPRKMLTTDPNQSVEVKRIMDSIYLNGDNALERALLQNRNIARMPIGPGSTIKIPFYVALLSEVDIPWEKLGVSYPGNRGFYVTLANENGKSRDLIYKFGPDKLERKHGLGDNKGWDEMAGEYSKNAGGVLNPSDFIATSNNFYYGSVLMLGSYHADKLRGGLGNVLDESNNAEQVFPKFVLDNHYFKFKQNYLEDLSKNQLSYALEQGLRYKFQFNTTRAADNLIQFYDKQPVERLLHLNSGEGYTGMNALYVYSILPSYYNYIKGKNIGMKKQDIYNDHLNLTSGGVQKMDVTPLNMAEMYLRIALQNGYKGSLLTYQDDAEGCPVEKLSDFESFQGRMKETTYTGMWKVINQSGTWHGTLKGCVGDKLAKELADAGIFLYGKTGTAGTTKKVGGVNQANNNYHYAFILSNKNLHENNYNPENLKIYVVYFGYYNGTLGHYGTKESRDEIIHKIINSETFRDYWNND